MRYKTIYKTTLRRLSIFKTYQEALKQQRELKKQKVEVFIKAY